MSTSHPVVSRSEWLAARTALLAQEKAFTKARDRLSEQRRALPWVKVEKEYVFEGPRGKVRLADLFGAHGQLSGYPFMFAPDWQAGFKSRPLFAAPFVFMIVVLTPRDVRLLVVLRG